MAELRFKFDWDWTDADRHYRQAIEANPNFAQGRWMYASFLAAAGRVHDAVTQASEAEQSIRSRSRSKDTVAMMLFYDRRYADAERKAAEAVALDDNFPRLMSRAAARSQRSESSDQAIEELHQALALAKDNGVMAELGRIYAVAGRRDGRRQDPEAAHWRPPGCPVRRSPGRGLYPGGVRPARRGAFRSRTCR